MYLFNFLLLNNERTLPHPSITILNLSTPPFTLNLLSHRSVHSYTHSTYSSCILIPPVTLLTYEGELCDFVSGVGWSNFTDLCQNRWKNSSVLKRKGNFLKIVMMRDLLFFHDKGKSDVFIKNSVFTHTRIPIKPS